MTSLFWVIIGSTGQSVLKPFSSWVRKVLCIFKAHISLGCLWWAATSAAVVAGVSLVSILQAGDWANSFYTGLVTIFPLALLLWISTRTLYRVLCSASVSRSSLGKCQTLTCIQSCIYGLSGCSSPHY